MFLTRMMLNPRRRQTHRFRADPQVMHAAVMSSFPPQPSPQRVLWRWEVSGEQLSFLLLSEKMPSLEHFQEQAGWSSEKTWESRNYDQLIARLQQGQQFAFRLRGNPVRETVVDGKHKRVAHVSIPYQKLWLVEREEKLGVRFIAPPNLDDQLDIETQPRSDLVEQVGDSRLDDPRLALVDVSERGWSKFRRGNHRVSIAWAQYDGCLEIVNRELLAKALTQGVGRARAYGCGLLTLAPLPAGGHK